MNPNHDVDNSNTQNNYIDGRNDEIMPGKRFIKQRPVQYTYASDIYVIEESIRRSDVNELTRNQ